MHDERLQPIGHLERAWRDNLQPFRTRRHDLNRQTRSRRRCHRIVHGLDDHPQRKGLAQKTIGLQAHRLDHRLRRVIAGHHDDQRRTKHPADLREHVEAIHAGQIDVQQHRIELANRQPLEGLRTVGRLLDEIPGVDQHLP
jgi:hypothetical protein